MATLWRKLVKGRSLNMRYEPRQPRALFTWAGGGRISWHTCWWGLCTPEQLCPEAVSSAHRRFPGLPQAALWDANIAALNKRNSFYYNRVFVFAASQVLQTWMKCERVAGKMKLKYDSCYKNKPAHKLSHETKLTMTLSNKTLSKRKTPIMKRPLTTNG